MHAIILVGGKGTRLARYTKHRPKALVELGRYSILEIILRQLRGCGFARVTLCISHLGHMIRDEFGDGRRLGLAIDYSVDEHPLGTAAPLRLVPDWTEPAVVMNGDLLTTLDFAGLRRAHDDSGSLLTVATRRRQMESSVGLLRLHEDRVTAVWEKPVVEWNISAGIYVADPFVRKYIPPGERIDMPGLITALIEHGELVYGHEFRGAWHDIGTPGDYKQARAEFCLNPARYLTRREPGMAAIEDRAAVGAMVGTAAGDTRPRLDVSAYGEHSLATSR
jgi:NDP-sugar pyrophosphorylase family protein